MINRIEILEQAISNIDFHINHANAVLLNPELYLTPSNKTEENLDQYLSDLLAKKQALQAELETLTNQG